ncbi:Type 1 glutamine amidotransferase-like domain-containing protein [Dermatobacter hominis]|uniref:Type 1 glutamine amidotransferase-like domain-containing protein n=1 Tax=Dermatobacter hominis TaxID=2884263 RepID=UPI001D1034EF|nr:Type 1 glutamine amidotransferase-like domain-containing protein [Dermatobacter hominis]UDY34382.1 Type 1 glutamine amidotransferase-like domain-containing protein [Dermatobacter hominis]
MTGTLALVGGMEWTEGCTFDEALVAGASEVLVIPAALAYENPGAAVQRARDWFDRFGVGVRVLDVYRRAEALEPAPAEIASAAEVIYVVGGSPMHLRSVLKDTPLLDAMVGAWRAGATVAASGEAASVLSSYMVDSRGGAFTVGLDLIETITVIPRSNIWSHDKWHRTVELARPGLAVVGIDEATALIHAPDGTWRVEGAGGVQVFRDGKPAELSALPSLLRPEPG